MKEVNHMNMDNLPKIIITMGFVIMIGGIILWAASKIGINLFRLPGDIVIKRDNFTFYFPLVTCIVLSVIITVLLGLFGRK